MDIALSTQPPPPWLDEATRRANVNWQWRPSKRFAIPLPKQERFRPFKRQRRDIAAETENVEAHNNTDTTAAETDNVEAQQQEDREHRDDSSRDRKCGGQQANNTETPAAETDTVRRRYGRKPIENIETIAAETENVEAQANTETTAAETEDVSYVIIGGPQNIAKNLTQAKALPKSFHTTQSKTGKVGSHANGVYVHWDELRLLT